MLAILLPLALQKDKVESSHALCMRCGLRTLEGESNTSTYTTKEGRKLELVLEDDLDCGLVASIVGKRPLKGAH